MSGKILIADEEVSKKCETNADVSRLRSSSLNKFYNAPVCPSMGAVKSAATVQKTGNCLCIRRFFFLRLWISLFIAPELISRNHKAESKNMYVLVEIIF